MNRTQRTFVIRLLLGIALAVVGVEASAFYLFTSGERLGGVLVANIVFWPVPVTGIAAYTLARYLKAGMVPDTPSDDQ